MALTTVSEGAASSANDLNQVVNLLNGTTTNTQVTVNGPIGANLAGTSGYARLVGGTPVAPITQWPTPGNGGGYSIDLNTYYSPYNIPLTYGQTTATGNGTYYQPGDLAWAPGGPLFIGATAPTSQGFVTSAPVLAGFPTVQSQITIGTGGYFCRIHQTAAVTITSNNQFVTGDTIDFDPRGMIQPSFLGSGIAITIPFPGTWAFLGAVHATASTNNVAWAMGFGDGFSVTTTPMSCLDSSSSGGTVNVYTGAVSFNATSVGFGDRPLNISPGFPVQIGLYTQGAPSPSFSLDVSASDRNFIAAWLIG